MSKGAATRKTIVDRAFHLANEVGLEGLTLGVLADELRLSKSGLFAHFKSKESLQLQVLQEAIERFVAKVVTPALTKARGEPRVKALLDNYVRWVRESTRPGGCLFNSAAQEFDDRPGPVRELLAQSQRDWLATLAKAASIAVDEGHFHAEVDAEQFAYEVKALVMGFQHSLKLLEDPKAEKRARIAFEALLDRCRSRRKRTP